MADVSNISNGTNGSYDADSIKNNKVETTQQKSKNKYSLDMQDFLALLVKQISNQDMMNPMDDSQMVAQMAQMATVQAMTQFSEITTTTYAASLVGKEVVMADTSNGIKEISGVVTGCGFYGGEPILFVDGKSFYLNQLMAVGKLPEEEKPDDGKGEDGSDTETGGSTDGDKTEGTEKA